MQTERMTMAQALVRFLNQQYVSVMVTKRPLWRASPPSLGTARAHIGLRWSRDRPSAGDAGLQRAGHRPYGDGFAKQHRQRILPSPPPSASGAANMVTAAATATANRIPLRCFRDIYASRQPDPVLQQIEQYHDLSISTNDCFRPVSRYWDRITVRER
jgi:3D-(3,5/4)-trihydroxycyclohexane-1,2-dione acylhydrolase (decyclizing)